MVQSNDKEAPEQSLEEKVNIDREPAVKLIGETASDISSCPLLKKNPDKKHSSSTSSGKSKTSSDPRNEKKKSSIKGKKSKCSKGADKTGPTESSSCPPVITDKPKKKKKHHRDPRKTEKAGSKEEHNVKSRKKNKRSSSCHGTKKQKDKQEIEKKPEHPDLSTSKPIPPHCISSLAEANDSYKLLSYDSNQSEKEGGDQEKSKCEAVIWATQQQKRSILDDQQGRNTARTEDDDLFENSKSSPNQDDLESLKSEMGSKVNRQEQIPHQLRTTASRRGRMLSPFCKSISLRKANSRYSFDSEDEWCKGRNNHPPTSSPRSSFERSYELLDSDGSDDFLFEETESPNECKNQASHADDISLNSQTHNKSKKKSVGFDSITVHYHSVVLGDCPMVTSGPPIARGWERVGDSEVYTDIDAYEDEYPVWGMVRTLPAKERYRALEAAGYSREEITIFVHKIRSYQQEVADEALLAAKNQSQLQQRAESKIQGFFQRMRQRRSKQNTTAPSYLSNQTSPNKFKSAPPPPPLTKQNSLDHSFTRISNRKRNIMQKANSVYFSKASSDNHHENSLLLRMSN